MVGEAGERTNVYVHICVGHLPGRNKFELCLHGSQGYLPCAWISHKTRFSLSCRDCGDGTVAVIKIRWFAKTDPKIKWKKKSTYWQMLNTWMGKWITGVLWNLYDLLYSSCVTRARSCSTIYVSCIRNECRQTLKFSKSCQTCQWRQR